MKKLTVFAIIALLSIFAFHSLVSANQVGISWTKDNIGILGDYEKGLHENVDLNLDAQIQRGDTVSAIGNASVLFHARGVGLKPFIAYNRDELGDITDVGGVINFNIGAVDVSGGASVRGSNPVADGGIDGFDADGNSIKYYTDDPTNTYAIPDGSNINAVFQGAFEKWDVETALTAYVPITEREIVPMVLISRSQTALSITDDLSVSVILDARTYVHSDGIHIEFTPAGAAILKF